MLHSEVEIEAKYGLSEYMNDFEEIIIDIFNERRSFYGSNLTRMSD
jgi:hypothetical protein